ncbi:hypothetical protein COMA2_150013 [Candidatus Nitrospira nitrificans]|uniref:Uncharacterized protein n=1 Tax=Candidatus Nitrospira nitrificans TaxID=1742973 RepID=A0A0S4LAU3_9BACT|nr:hypothetical protein COMA2_150013 [Candidatus Nitrospira nitrificans]
MAQRTVDRSTGFLVLSMNRRGPPCSLLNALRNLPTLTEEPFDVTIGYNHSPMPTHGSPHCLPSDSFF